MSEEINCLVNHYGQPCSCFRGSTVKVACVNCAHLKKTNEALVEIVKLFREFQVNAGIENEMSVKMDEAIKLAAQKEL